MPTSAGRPRTAASCGCGRRRGWTPPRTPPLHPLPRPPPAPAPRTAPRPRRRPARQQTARRARMPPTAAPPPGTRPRGTPRRGRRGRRRMPHSGAAGSGWGGTLAQAPPTACTRQPARPAGSLQGRATTRVRAPVPRTASLTAPRAMGWRRAPGACASSALRTPTVTPAATAASQARAPQTSYLARQLPPDCLPQQATILRRRCARSTNANLVRCHGTLLASVLSGFRALALLHCCADASCLTK